MKKLLLTMALAACVAVPATAADEQPKQKPSVCGDVEKGTFRSNVCYIFGQMDPFFNKSRRLGRIGWAASGGPVSEHKTDVFTGMGIGR